MCDTDRFLDSNYIQTADFSNDTGIEHLILAWNELSSLDGVELPARVYELYVALLIIAVSFSTLIALFLVISKATPWSRSLLARYPSPWALCTYCSTAITPEYAEVPQTQRRHLFLRL